MREHTSPQAVPSSQEENFGEVGKRRDATSALRGEWGSGEGGDGLGCGVELVDFGGEIFGEFEDVAMVCKVDDLVFF